MFRLELPVSILGIGLFVSARRSDSRTAKIVDLVCKLCDETGDFVASLTILTKHVPVSVADRVLFFPEKRRAVSGLAGCSDSPDKPGLLPFS
jgi:hypothetical protein